MGTRILVTGMGGELGTRVTNLLEADPRFEAIVGIDLDPPRRRIPLAEFHRVDPRDRSRTISVVTELDPHVVLHLGVYEPDARRGPQAAAIGTQAAAENVFGAAALCPSLQHLVVRSGIEVYGRGRGAARCPDESVAPAPTSPFGRSLLAMEQIASEAAFSAAVPLTTLRLAPVVGPHFPSPLGRYLRLPAVPVGAVSHRPFSLLHQDDAALALVAAVDTLHHGPVNVVADGALTALRAVCIGGRVPVPVLGPGWLAAAAAASLIGAPLPGHVRELIVRGRTADGALATEVLGRQPSRSTEAVVRELYEWAEVEYLDVVHGAVA